MAALQTQFNRNVTTLANGLAQGRVSLDSWQNLMSQQIRQYHMSAALAANGGQPTAAMLATAQARATEQVGFMNAWADEMRAGTFPVDAASRIAARAKLYGGAGTATFNQGLIAARGIPNLGIYPGSGATRCRTNCKCTIDIEETDTEWLIFWRLHPAEHCLDCLRLATQWSPRRIPK